MPLRDIMVDLETAGTVASAAIVSIGAVRFDIATGEMDPDGFYTAVSVDSNMAAGRQISEATLIWWLTQSKEAQSVFADPKRVHLDVALEMFEHWFGTDKNSQHQKVWSNGADFDIPMLGHAYYVRDKSIPWAPFNARCMRTLKNLPGADKAPKPARLGTHHNALADAVYQAEYAHNIHKHLFGGRK